MLRKKLKNNKYLRKIQPKLRMISNGSLEVNEMRADFNSALCVREDLALDSINPTKAIVKLLGTGRSKKGKLKGITGAIEASVFIANSNKRSR